MYIISKRKDYYDGVVGSVGIDKTIVYEREKIEIEEYVKFPDEFRSNQPWRKWNDRNHFLDLNKYAIKQESKYEISDNFIIGFCGKLYLGWKFHWRTPSDHIHYGRFHTKVVYDLDEVKKHLRESNFFSSNLVDDINYVHNYNPMDLFREYKTPVFVYDSHYKRSSIDSNWRDSSRFIINPILKEYEFYKVFDPFTTFQEIQMFISGVLGTGEKEIIEVEDKYKIGQHGFDKWSFRKEPTKKR